MSQISNEVVALSDKIKKAVEVDASTGVITTPKDLYESLLPETLTIEQVKTLQEHNSQVIAASAKAVGELAIPLMAENKELDRVSLEIGVGHKDKINVTFDRSRQVPDRETNGTKTKHGIVSADYTMYGAKSRGEMLKVKNELAEAALKALA